LITVENTELLLLVTSEAYWFRVIVHFMRCACWAFMVFPMSRYKKFSVLLFWRR